VQASAAAEKSNQTVYLIAGGVALLALFYFMSKRK
jgi:LPXTG-motif cell wall-anchored protein